jgi:GST-like protein
MSSEREYSPPKVWSFEQAMGGNWLSVNRPTSGATHEKVLQRGQHPIQLYSLGTANGMKISILLEELLAAGEGQAEYDAWLIDINVGDQFGSGFTELNPNSKIPALIDFGAQEPVRIFESGAILLYLAEKFGRFLPSDTQGRMDCLSWLFWQVGSTPYYGGGFAHFYHLAPTKLEYPINRFAMEVKRQLHVLNRHLDGRAFILGDDYSIADIAIFPWYGALQLQWGFQSAEFLSLHEYPQIQRWADALSARPAVGRGRRVNRIFGNLPGAVRERHDADDLND